MSGPNSEDAWLVKHQRLIPHQLRGHLSPLHSFEKVDQDLET